MKTTLAVLFIALMPGLAAAQCFGHSAERQAMSCADGTMFDTETGTCVPVVTG